MARRYKLVEKKKEKQGHLNLGREKIPPTPTKYKTKKKGKKKKKILSAERVDPKDDEMDEEGSECTLAEGKVVE